MIGGIKSTTWPESYTPRTHERGRNKIKAVYVGLSGLTVLGAVYK